VTDDKIIDLQHYQLKSVNDRYDLLVDYCRDNLSTQSQVHKAVLRLVQARNIEQVLEILAIDLPVILDVDVVRLAMESDIPVDTAYGEQHYSGVVFIDSGASDEIFGAQRSVVCVGDAREEPTFAFEQIFVDCDELIESFALIRLSLENIEKNIILALGTRHKNRFKTGQSAEILHFLAQIVALQLDKYLDDLSL
jgi:hypothetical protein